MVVYPFRAFAVVLAVQSRESAVTDVNKPKGVPAKWWLGQDCGGCKNRACPAGDTCMLDDGSRPCEPTDALTECSCQPNRSGGMELRAFGVCVNHEGKEPARSAILLEHDYLQCKKLCDSRADCTGISFNGGDCYVYTTFPITPPQLPGSANAECYVASMLNSVDWPVLPITRRHYIGCFRDNSQYDGVINKPTDSVGNPIARVGLNMNARICAWHCTSLQRTHFALRAVSRRRHGKRVKNGLCLCGDGYRQDDAKFERVGDINCMPSCQGEDGPCGGSYFNAMYAIPVPADGADCPNGSGHRAESSYIYLQGTPPSTYPQIVNDTLTTSCHECAMACSEAPQVQSMECHAYSCDYAARTSSYRCRLFSLPIPTTVMAPGTGGQHMCVLRKCVTETQCVDGYTRIEGFTYLTHALNIAGLNSTMSNGTQCAACAQTCTENGSCVAYQCSNTLRYCHLFASRVVNNTIAVSDVSFCAKIPDQTCAWSYGTLATATDCRCGQNKEVCVAGMRCKIDGVSQFGTCVPPTPSCTTNADCPCTMGTCAAHGYCVNCEDSGCPSAISAVCGADNKTYDNACYASCNLTRVAHDGSCSAAQPYPNCTDDLVSSGLMCGSDGKTYLNKCALIASLGSLIGASKGECKRQCKSGETECTCGTEYCSNGANGRTVCTDLGNNSEKYSNATTCKPPCDSMSSTDCACNINGIFTTCDTGSFCVLDTLGRGSCGNACNSCSFTTSRCTCGHDAVCASGDWCEDGQCLPRCGHGSTKAQSKCRCGATEGATCGVRIIDGLNVNTLCPVAETEGRSSNTTCMPACTGTWAINCICISENEKREVANSVETGGPYVCINGKSREKVCDAENRSNCRCGKHMALCGSTDNVRTYCNATSITEIGACVAECVNYDSVRAYPSNCACPSSTDRVTSTIDFCETHTYCGPTRAGTFACKPGCTYRLGEAANDGACICAAGRICAHNEPFCLNPKANSMSIYTGPHCRTTAVPSCAVQNGSTPSSATCVCGEETICDVQQICIGGKVKQCVDSAIKECPHHSCVSEACICDTDPCPVGHLCVRISKSSRACTPPIKRCKADNLENCLCGPADKSSICQSGSRCTEPGPQGSCEPLPPPWWEKPHTEYCSATKDATQLFATQKKHSHLFVEKK